MNENEQQFSLGNMLAQLLQQQPPPPLQYAQLAQPQYPNVQLNQLDVNRNGGGFGGNVSTPFAGGTAGVQGQFYQQRGGQPDWSAMLQYKRPF